jgi:hypothetical protein
LHGWPTHLLPYIEQDELFKKIDLSRPWDDPVNAAHFTARIVPYHHSRAPEKDAEGRPLIHYALNAALVNGGRPLTVKQLTEGRGAANTILAAEAHGNWRPWGHPVHWRDVALGLNRSPNGFGSPLRPPHPVAFVMADGSVRSFSGDTDPDFLELLAAPAN